MNPFLKEIIALRGQTGMEFDCQNSNPYGVVCVEPNGSRTAYYFNTPIYNEKTGKLLDMKFHSANNMFCAVGSNSEITIDQDVLIHNPEGYCKIALGGQFVTIFEHELVGGGLHLRPTTNGISIRGQNNNEGQLEFSLKVSESFLSVRANDKYFALMRDDFRPFLVVSCIGTIDVTGRVVSPSILKYHKISCHEYKITISSCLATSKAVSCEINLYEPKLYQDTTVESNHPGDNNVYGSIGFIGETNEFGEQWLYSRLDYQKTSELHGHKVRKAILHLPNLNESKVQLGTEKVPFRFCSFGSTWSNKITSNLALMRLANSGKYYDADLTSILTDKHGRFTNSEGWIVKAYQPIFGYAVVPTGDSHMSSQILEINSV